MLQKLLPLAAVIAFSGTPAFGQQLTADQSRVLADSLRQYAQDMVATVRSKDAVKTAEFYDQSARFKHFENGQVETWATLQPKMKAFMAAAREIDLRWGEDPKIIILSRDAAVITGIDVFKGVGPDGKTLPSHRGTWSGVVQRINGQWKLVHSHSSHGEGQPH